MAGELGKDLQGPSCLQVKATASDYVQLNVGGSLFHTTRSTLAKQDTMLRAMFSGRLPTVSDSDGWILIDRSGRHFGIILDFLRDGSVPLPDCRFEVEQIHREARYYLVQVSRGEEAVYSSSHESVS